MSALTIRQLNICDLLVQSALTTAVCWIHNERECDPDDIYENVRNCMISALNFPPEIGAENVVDESTEFKGKRSSIQIGIFDQGTEAEASESASIAGDDSHLWLQKRK